MLLISLKETLSKKFEEYAIFPYKLNGTHTRAGTVQNTLMTTSTKLRVQFHKEPLVRQLKQTIFNTKGPFTKRGNL